MKFTTFNTGSRHIPHEILVIILDFATMGIHDTLPPNSVSIDISHLILVSSQFHEAYLSLTSERDLGLQRIPLPLDHPCCCKVAHPPFNELSSEEQEKVILLIEAFDADDSFAIPTAIKLLRRSEDSEKIVEKLEEQSYELEYQLSRNEQPPIYSPIIGSSLDFYDLSTLIRYFKTGPGSLSYYDGNSATRNDRLAKITFLSQVYGDPGPRLARDEFELRYASEAFEMLVAVIPLLRLKHIHISSSPAYHMMGPEIDGMSSLLKIRGIRRVSLQGWHWNDVGFNETVRRSLQSPIEPWTPLDIESSEPPRS
jgi:hypothetical protein